MFPRGLTAALAAAAGLSASPALAQETLTQAALAQEAAAEAAHYGLWSLVPPLVAIVLALISRDVVVAIFVGIFSGAAILANGDLFAAFGRSIDAYLVPAVADGDHAAILVFTALLGAMVGLVTKSGGTHGIIQALQPWATSPRRGQLATWAMGMLVFFDDYANTLIVGPTMRPITDRLRISREKLAYLVDSTAAPVVCLVPISTWVGFEVGLVGDAFEQIGLANDPYSVFFSSIPYRFYPIFAILAVVLIAALRRDAGPMLAAERRARQSGAVLAADARPIADYSSEEVEPPAAAPKRAVNALLPILTVIAITLVGLWRTGTNALLADGVTEFSVRQVLEQANSYEALLWASLSGVMVAFLLPLVQRILSVGQAVGATIAGMKAMFLALLVLVLAWSLSAVCDALGTAQFLVELASQSVDPRMMPAITFVLAAAVAFATGSSWGTMGILEPLVIPIVHSLAIEHGMEVGGEAYMAALLGTIASVLAGSVWGDHCSPISDTTILSSMASGCDHIAHVRTQLPYALPVGLAAVVLGCLPAGYGLHPAISLGIGSVLLVLAVRFVGRPVEDGPVEDGPDSSSALEPSA